MGRQAVVVEAVVPIRVRHEDCGGTVRVFKEGKKEGDRPLRCAKRIAMAEGLLRAVPLMETIFATRSGWR